MSYRIVFELDSFDSRASAEALVEVVDALCMGLAEANAQYLIDNPDTPLVYSGIVRYQEERPGREEFFDIPRVIRQGYADCEDLASWRAAELVVRYGVPAQPFATYQLLPNGDIMFHVQVRTRDRIEDPSVVLGMRRLGE